MVELAEPDLTTDPVGEAVEALATRGYGVIDDFLPPGLAPALAADLQGWVERGGLSSAGVGRETARREDQAVRRAGIRWFDGDSPAERGLLDFAETIRLAINRRLYLGLFDFECNFIAYPSGGFYGRHLDSLSGSRNRVVSLVAYLDDNWRAEEGGLLRLWPTPEADGEPAAIVVPAAGRVVLMLSEEIPHEVTPSTRPRHAIAGWWRVQTTGGPAP
jgi:SM-20-related protein